MTPNELVFERKFDTAIRRSTINGFFARQTDDDATFDDKILLAHVQEDDLQSISTKPDCYAHFLEHILRVSDQDLSLDNVKKSEFQHALDLAWKNLELQHLYSSSETRTPSKKEADAFLRSRIAGWSCPQVLINLSVVAKRLDECVRKMSAIESSKAWKMRSAGDIDGLKKISSAKVPEVEWTISWSGRLAYISSPDSSWIMPRSYILMIHNKIHDLISTTLLSIYLSGVCYSQDFWKRQLLFVRHLVTLCIRYGDKFFQIAAALEGLTVGETLRRVDQWDNKDLLENLSVELNQDIGYDYENSILQSYLQRCSIPEMHEFSCLSKIVGHPLVDLNAGIDKVRKRANEDLDVDLESIRMCVNLAKKQTVKSYFFRHGKWPPCEVEPPKLRSDALMYAMLKNIEPDDPSLSYHGGPIQVDDWERVTFQPFLHFQEYENCIPFLKDKTISLLKTDVVRHYLRGTSEGRIPWRDTRLLLFYLLHNKHELCHTDYLHRYMEVDDLEELQNYLVTRLVPKEKELKLEPRFFGACTFQERMRRLVQEKNAMHYLDLYSDEQALTLGELEISSRLYAFRKIRHAYADHAVVRIQLDASGWNHRFRHQTVAPVADAVLDKPFATSLYWRTMQAYEHTFHYVPDEEKVTVWEGQLGGIEGLNQDTWDIVYLNQIRAAMYNENLKYHMLVKGDDLRIAVMIPPNLLAINPVDWWSRRLMHSVSDTAKKFGHNLKVKESYASEVYFSFSKAASVRTIELPQGNRKILKVYGANNAFLETLDDYIASTFSNAHSAARVLPNHYGPYWVALAWSYWYLLNDPAYRALADDQLVATLLVPGLLGGFPIIYLHNMSVRAESDLLSPFIHIWKWTQHNYPAIHLVLDSFFRHRIGGRIQYEQLYRDPYSLQLGVPATAKATLQRYVLPAVERITKNLDMKELIRATKSSTAKEIVACLNTAEPCDAKVLSVIFSCTPTGVLEEMLRKFETGRSVYDLIFLSGSSRKRTERILMRVHRSDQRLQEWRRSRIQNRVRHIPHLLVDLSYDCPAQLAQELREKVWRRRVTGLTMPPMAHQVKLVLPTAAARDQHALRNHFLYEYSPPTEAIDTESSIHWASAGKRPFLGYTTRTGNIMPTMNFEEKDAILVRVKNSLDLLSWVTRSLNTPTGIVLSNIEELIKRLIMIYSPITPAELAPFSAHRKSGTVQHHIRSRSFRESIVPNCLSNLYQNFTGHTDSHITLRSNKAAHYTVNFLHILCHSISQLSVETQVSPTMTTSRTSWAITTDCKFCITPIVDYPIRIDTNYIPIEMENPLRVCAIDEQAKNTIMRSYTNFNERLFHTVDETQMLPHEIASYAIASEIVYKWERTRIKLQQRYGIPSVTSEAYSILSSMSIKTVTREVGRTELKCINLRAVFECIRDIVINYTLNNRETFSLEEMKASYITTPAAELPWYGLVDRVMEVGRLADLVRIVTSDQGITRTGLYNNTAAATAWIGSACCTVPQRAMENIRIVFLTYMVDTDVSKIVRQRLDSIKWSILNSDVVPYMRAYNPEQHAPEVREDIKTSLLVKFIAVCSMDIDDEIVANLVAQYRNQHEFQECYLHNMLADWRDNFAEVCEEGSVSYWALIVQWGNKTWPRWPWGEVIKKFIEARVHPEPAFQQVIRLSRMIKFQIAVTNLDTAIQAVRGMDDEDAESEETERIPEVARWRSVVFRRSASKRYNLKEGTIAGVEDAGVLPRYDFTVGPIVLMEAHTHRICGTTTSAMSKLMEILSGYGITIPLPQGSYFSCLGDGFGGFVECLASLSRACYFIYNTKPDREGITCYPDCAHESLEAGNHHVYNEEIESGVWDLRDRLTVTILAENHPLSHIVTCDAEVPWDGSADAFSIWENVVLYASKVLEDNGLCIVKVHLGLPEDVARVSQLACKLFKRVCLTKPTSSLLGGEMYLVALDPRSPRAEVAGYTWVREPSIRCRELVRRAIEDQYRHYEDSLRVPRTKIYFPLTPQQMYMVKELPLLADTVVQTRIGVAISLRRGLLLKQYARAEVAGWYYGQVLKIKDALEKDLRHDEHVIDFPGMETYMHKMQVAMRVLACEGILLWMKGLSRLSSWETEWVGHEQVETGFVRAYERMPRRLKLPPWEVGNNALDWHLKDYPRLNPYLRYMEGVRAGQSITGCIGVACTPIYRQRRQT